MHNIGMISLRVQACLMFTFLEIRERIVGNGSRHIQNENWSKKSKIRTPLFFYQVNYKSNNQSIYSCIYISDPLLTWWPSALPTTTITTPTATTTSHAAPSAAGPVILPPAPLQSSALLRSSGPGLGPGGRCCAEEENEL